MKIALAIDSDYYREEDGCKIPSGIVVYTRGLASALTTHGHEVHILCTEDSQEVGVTNYEYEESKVHAFRIPWSAARLTFAEIIHDWLLANPMDVVEAHQMNYPLLIEQMVGGTATVARCASGFMDSLRGGRPSLESYAGALLDYEPVRKIKWSTHLMENMMLAQADVVLCAGQQPFDTARALTDRARVIPLGIEEVDECPLSAREIVLISVSRFGDPRKGGEIVPSILKHIPSKYRVVVLGEAAKDHPIMRELSHLEGCDLLTEPIAEVGLHALYREAAAVIVPTKSESFGYNLLEPMAQGRPVICFDQLDPSKRHWPLFNLGQWGSPEALAKIPEVLAQIELIGYVPLSVQMKEFARNFTWDKLIPSYEEAYTQAIAHSLLSGRTRGW